MTSDDETTGTDGVPVAPSVVVHGVATPEELAALVAVLSAVAGGDEPASDGASSTWAARGGALVVFDRASVTLPEI